MKNRLILFVLLAYAASGLAVDLDQSALSVQDLIDQDLLPDVDANGTLDLSNKKLTSAIGLENIPNPEHVVTLLLSDNFITVLQEHAFDTFPHLLTLNLNHNPIVELKPNIFQTLSNLQTLSMEGMRLVQIEPHTLDPLQNLMHLTFEQNMLDSLPHNLLANLAHLQTLNLQFNKIRSLDPNFFANQKDSLENLGLTGNQLEQLPRISYLKKLKGLFITKNPGLHLDYSAVEFIKERKIFCNAPELMNGMPHYSLGDLIRDLGDNWQATLITTDPATGEQTLSLDNQNLTTLEGFTSEPMPQVVRISADNNYISFIPDEFFWQDSQARFPGLKEIFLSNNLLTAIPNLTPKVIEAELRVLVLQSNRITQIPALLQHIQDLRILSLATNNISTIEQNALNLPNLEMLRLQRNKLSAQPRDLFEPLLELRDLDLRYNYLGRKEDYAFPEEAEVSFYPQNPSSFKLLAARKVAENFANKNLANIYRTTQIMPAEVLDLILQAAPHAVREKINKVLDLKDLITHAHGIPINSLKELIQALPADSQEALLELASPALRSRIIAIAHGHPQATEKPSLKDRFKNFFKK